MDDKDIEQAETGTSRRSLLAKAAVGGAIVYAVPAIKSIPAYAAAGLDSYSSQSANCCVWFSPNQVNPGGKWHADLTNTVDGIVSKLDSGTTGSVAGGATMTVQVKVNGTLRNVTFTGNPNNHPGNLGRSTTEAFNYAGGGVAITSGDSNCEILIKKVACSGGISKASDCADSPTDTPTNDKAAPTSWDKGSSNSAINTGAVEPGGIGSDRFTGTVYYHTGRTGYGDGNRCKLGIKFVVRCK